MKYICNRCGDSFACIAEIADDVDNETPYSCIYANGEDDLSANWKPMQDRSFEMNGLCSDCSNNCSNNCSNYKDATLSKDQKEEMLVNIAYICGFSSM